MDGDNNNIDADENKNDGDGIDADGSSNDEVADNADYG